MKSITFQQLKDYASLSDLICDMPSVRIVDSSGVYILAPQPKYDNFIELDSDKQLMKRISEYAIQEQTISASALQRKFKLGYVRACKILDYMEDKGYISSADGIEPRRVFITQSQIDADFE